MVVCIKNLVLVLAVLDDVLGHTPLFDSVEVVLLSVKNVIAHGPEGCYDTIPDKPLQARHGSFRFATVMIFDRKNPAGSKESAYHEIGTDFMLLLAAEFLCKGMARKLEVLHNHCCF